MSQAALGQALGVTFQPLQKYERGSNRVGASRLQHRAEALDMQPSCFFEGMPDQTESSGHDVANQADIPRAGKGSNSSGRLPASAIFKCAVGSQCSSSLSASTIGNVANSPVVI
ncbi:helix-turn-helix domain-containing protein [Sinorhizobium meliloti]|uniref:helix-turn-helix domain-containing protein n=1 Tax=Rhizobium meliloti TaxID=382 RepID=UPI003EBBD0A2